MKLSLLPILIYECLTETADGIPKSTFFTSINPLKSRGAAITFLLEHVLSDEYKPEETLVHVYCRNLKTGERITLLTSETLYQTFENLSALEEELCWYQQEKVNADVALFHHKSSLIIVLGAKQQKLTTLNNPETSLILAHNYWVFLKRGRGRGMVA